MIAIRNDRAALRRNYEIKTIDWLVLRLHLISFAVVFR